MAIAGGIIVIKLLSPLEVRGSILCDGQVVFMPEWSAHYASALFSGVSQHTIFNLRPLRYTRKSCILALAKVAPFKPNLRA